MQIHATNINGLGASHVVISLLDAMSKDPKYAGAKVYLPEDGLLKNYNNKKSITKRYKRYLPNSISRFVECFFSRFFFKNEPTIVLGDIPLRRIKNQIVLVHQSNLIKPTINKYSGKSLGFKINRILFSLNHKYVRKIIVQTGAMAIELIASYPKIKDKVIVLPQPVPSWLQIKKVSKEFSNNKTILFYPSAFYPHKKHEFLIEVNEFLKNRKSFNFEIWLTLKDEEFIEFKNIKFVKNLGRLSPDQMNSTYSKVDALLFLSSMESYGLPLVEALSLNLPILVPDLKYSRWMCEDKAYYFEPYKINSFVKALDKLSKDIPNKKTVNYKKTLEKFPKDWETVSKTFLSSL